MKSKFFVFCKGITVKNRLENLAIYVVFFATSLVFAHQVLERLAK